MVYVKKITMTVNFLLLVAITVLLSITCYGQEIRAEEDKGIVLSSKNVRDTSITIQWTPYNFNKEDPNQGAQQYIVYQDNVAKQAIYRDNSLEINDLEPGKEYEFQVVATTNNQKPLSYSNKHKIKTKSIDKPEKKPVNKTFVLEQFGSSDFHQYVNLRRSLTSGKYQATGIYVEPNEQITLEFNDMEPSDDSILEICILDPNQYNTDPGSYRGYVENMRAGKHSMSSEKGGVVFLYIATVRPYEMKMSFSTSDIRAEQSIVTLSPLTFMIAKQIPTSLN